MNQIEELKTELSRMEKLHRDTAQTIQGMVMMSDALEYSNKLLMSRIKDTRTAIWGLEKGHYPFVTIQGGKA